MKRLQRIDPERFKTARLMAGFSFDACAQALGVTTRTVQNWEAGRGRIPYAAYKLLKILSGFALPDPSWDGWIFRRDTLWSPDGKAFPVGSLSYLAPVFAKARLWDKEQKSKKPPAQIPPDPVQLELPGVARIWQTVPKLIGDSTTARTHGKNLRVKRTRR